MTNLSSFILILVCLGIGYIIEPSFFSGSNRSPVASATADDQENSDPVSPDPEIIPEPVAETITETITEPISEPIPEDDGMQVDLSKITPADFPDKVTLKIACTIEVVTSGATMQLKRGAKVKPLRLEDNLLVFQPVGLPIEGKTEVTNTDFKALAAPLLLKRLQEAVANNDSSEGEMDAEPTPEPEVEPMPEPKVVEPTPEPEPAPEADNSQLDASAIVKLMKAGVADGKVTEFTAEQVVSWQAAEAMEFDGKTYQTGLVKFKAETILGTQEHDAIALIENGAIVKWMWAKTKLEMR